MQHPPRGSTTNRSTARRCHTRSASTSSPCCDVLLLQAARRVQDGRNLLAWPRRARIDALPLRCPLQGGPRAPREATACSSICNQNRPQRRLPPLQRHLAVSAGDPGLQWRPHGARNACNVSHVQGSLLGVMIRDAQGDIYLFIYFVVSTSITHSIRASGFALPPFVCSCFQMCHFYVLRVVYEYTPFPAPPSLFSRNNGKCKCERTVHQPLIAFQ